MIVVDLEHLGQAGHIAAYVLPSGEPAVVDPGPASTLAALEQGLADHGLALGDLRHVLLTHVHLDHAGVTGHLAARVPELRVHVHIEGAPHMADPERLVSSTRRTFGEAHDRLWGEMLPVPADRIRAWERGARPPFANMRAIPSPGHIGHHLAWLDEGGGILFAGDSMGIILGPDAPTHPPTPPPAIDLVAWERTLSELAGVGPERFAVTHFGVHEGFETRRAELAERLQVLEARVRRSLEGGKESDALEYEEVVRATLAPHRTRELIDAYFDVFPAATDWAGVRRYVEKSGSRPAGG